MQLLASQWASSCVQNTYTRHSTAAELHNSCVHSNLYPDINSRVYITNLITQYMYSYYVTLLAVTCTLAITSHIYPTLTDTLHHTATTMHAQKHSLTYLTN